VAELTRFIPARKPISAAVIVSDGRVLLVRRRVKEAVFRGSFPLGKSKRESWPVRPQCGKRDLRCL
jgi:hypothetical protein